MPFSDYNLSPSGPASLISGGLPGGYQGQSDIDLLRQLAVRRAMQLSGRNRSAPPQQGRDSQSPLGAPASAGTGLGEPIYTKMISGPGMIPGQIRVPAGTPGADFSGYAPAGSGTGSGTPQNAMMSNAGSAPSAAGLATMGTAAASGVSPSVASLSQPDVRPGFFGTPAGTPDQQLMALARQQGAMRAGRSGADQLAESGSLTQGG